MYCQSYKQAAVTHAHGLLRKARRLDNLLNIRSESTTASSTPAPNGSSDPECSKCHTHFSPAFYRRDTGTMEVDGVSSPLSGSSMSSPAPATISWLCHRCHFEGADMNGKAMGMSAS